MAAFNFLKKKTGEKEKLTGAPTPTEAPIPNNNQSDNLTELPEFPTMHDEKITPLPRIETFEGLEKDDVVIPSLSNDRMEKPTFNKLNMEPKQNIPVQETEEKIRDFPLKFEETKEEEEKFAPKKETTTLKKKVFDNEGPLFVNVKSYSGIMNYINVSGIARNFDISVAELEKIREKDNSELKSLSNSLEGLHKKIMIVDDIISKG